MGGSNGGLLVGATFVQRPDLFNAVVCQVPLLDMRRYSHLLAGASWMAEYGDPDKPEEMGLDLEVFAVSERPSPACTTRPCFSPTSTRDDRVHPAHARKMAARMLAQGHQLLVLRETIEGGHGGAADQRTARDDAGAGVHFPLAATGRRARRDLRPEIEYYN